MFFYDLCLYFGYFIKKGLNKKDNLWIRQSERNSCDHGKVRRKSLQENAVQENAVNWTDKENQAEGTKTTYSTGYFW